MTDATVPRLSEKEARCAQTALDVAIQAFKMDAAAFRAAASQAEKMNMPDQETGHTRIAEQFDRQAQETQTLLDRITQAIG